MPDRYYVIDLRNGIEAEVWFELLDNKQGLDIAIKDLKDNYKMYVERYLKWQKKSD